MEKKRICLFCERWASGGIESFIHTVASHLNPSQWEIDVVMARQEDSVFTETLRHKGIGFYELSGDLHRIVANHRQFRRLLRQRRYDVVHLHLYQGMTLYYAHIARQEGVPVRIAHSHNADLRESRTRRLKLLVHRWSCDRYGMDATHWLACSAEAAEFAFGSSGKGGRKGDKGSGRNILFVPNGVDIGRFRLNLERRQAIRKEWGWEQCLVIGNVGRLCSQKNQRFLLEVFEHVVQQRPDSRLLLVGEGEDLESLKAWAEQRNLGEAVRFCGTSRQVERLLWAMDIFVMPSLFEGLPLSVVEAQAAGLPILCSDTVSGQVKMTQSVQFLSLQAGVRSWAEQILAMGEEMAGDGAWLEQRMLAADQVRDAGFEQSLVIRQLQQIYEEDT